MQLHFAVLLLASVLKVNKNIELRVDTQRIQWEEESWAEKSA